MCELWLTKWLEDANPDNEIRSQIETDTILRIEFKKGPCPLKDRIVILLDGKYFQIETIFDKLINWIVENDLRVEFIKLPAACSLSYQPNDLMVAFKLIKMFIKFGKFWESEVIDPKKKRADPVWLTRLKATELKNMKAGSAN